MQEKVIQKAAISDPSPLIGHLAGEQVHFSSRMEILVSKFGRTSKLSPRFLVVVSVPWFECPEDEVDICLVHSQSDKAVYFVISTLREGHLVTSCERKIPLITIRAVSLSNLRDDWMVSGEYSVYG